MSYTLHGFVLGLLVTWGQWEQVLGMNMDIKLLPYNILKFCGTILKGPSIQIMEDSLVRDNSFIINK